MFYVGHSYVRWLLPVKYGSASVNMKKGGINGKYRPILLKFN